MSDVDPRDDLPHPPGDLPLWSENYMFCGFDREREIGFYHHLGTLPHDPTRWGGMACLVLPGGELVLAKDYGRGDTAAGPASPALGFRCEEPLRRWRLQKDGMGFPAPASELAKGLLTDRAPTPMDCDLVFEGLAPVWDMLGGHAETAAFHTHHQQAGTVRGRFRVGENTFDFAGAGYRDHSVGPRDVRGLVGHVWFHAWMPSGRVLQGMTVAGLGGTGLSAGYVAVNGTLQDAEIAAAPAWTGDQGDPGAWAIELRTAMGPVTATGVSHTAIPWTLESPNEILLGQDHDRPGALLAFSALSTWTWDGEVGPGLLEMSVRP